MPKITSIRHGKSDGILLIALSECEPSLLTVGEIAYGDAGFPAVGEEIAGDALAILKSDDERRRALKKALSLLAFSDKSERALAAKLAQAGFSRDVVRETVEETVRLGYVNEERQIERIVENEATSKMLAPSRLIPRIASKGFAPSKISAVIREMENDGRIDFDAIREKLLARLPENGDEDERKKILYKHGFLT